MPRLLFVTGTAPDVPEGSGTHIGISVLREALEARGHRVEVLAPAPHRGPVSLLRRLHFNVRARRLARELLPDLDVIVGFDLDGFLLQSGGVRQVAAIKGVLADESGFEHGLPHVRLTVESLLERRHVRQVDRILATSAYSAGRIAEEYGVPAHRIAVVPEPIDLARWRRAFESAPQLPRGGNSILCVAHLYPRKNVATLPASNVARESSDSVNASSSSDTCPSIVSPASIGGRMFSAFHRGRRALVSCSSRRWRRACRSSPRERPRCPKWSPTAKAGFSSLPTARATWRPRSIGCFPIPRSGVVWAKPAASR